MKGQMALAVAGMSLASLLAMPWPAHAGCQKDTDCKGQRICANGECVDPNEPQRCDKDLDCAGDLVCRAGTCSAPSDAGGPAPAVTPAAPPPAAPPGPVAAPAPPGAGGPFAAGDTEPNSKGLMIAGAVLLPVGVVTASIGLFWLAAKPERLENHPESYVPLWAIGTVAAATGIVFLSIGAPQVPAERASASADEPIRLEPLLGPTGGGVRVTF
jgi:hypothetical protein